MPHGETISLEDAQVSIRKYVDDEIARTGKLEREIVVGHRFDLALIKSFLAEIEKLISGGAPIDSIRVYLAKDRRGSLTTDDYDVIMVPTLSTEDDHHRVYIPKEKFLADPTIIGHSTPCPNVCSKKALSCPE
jgi:hypothetical protein